MADKTGDIKKQAQESAVIIEDALITKGLNIFKESILQTQNQ